MVALYLFRYGHRELGFPHQMSLTINLLVMTWSVNNIYQLQNILLAAGDCAICAEQLFIVVISAVAWSTVFVVGGSICSRTGMPAW